MIKAKVAILTEHKSVNYGSVLQTHSLYNVLSKRNEVVELLRDAGGSCLNHAAE